MDAVSYSLASKQAQRIEKFIENPDSTSGIVTVPKVIASGETVTVPAGRVAVLPNVQVDGTLNVEGEVFIPSGATLSGVVELEGDQTISDVKTFLESPIVPTPTTGTQAVNKDYADTKQDKLELITITGSATFNGTTQNINLTNIGNITLAIGDVIEVTGTTSNNKLFTVESIVDNNNIVVNYEHRGTSTPVPKGRLINETASGCTIKLYNRAKNAPVGQGQYWCVPASTRALGQNYTNNTKRTINVSVHCNLAFQQTVKITVDGITSFQQNTDSAAGTDLGVISPVQANGIYNASGGTLIYWSELR